MKSKSIKIVLIGAGNVATKFGIALKNKRHSILQIYSKHKSSSSVLAKKLKSSFITSPEKIITSADIYIISVNDDSIAEVVSVLKSKINKNAIVVHTSGSIDMKELAGVSNNIGVIYPIQTLSKHKEIQLHKIPVCIEANNSATLKKVESIARTISTNIHTINSEQRKIIHLAAVFSNNFTNHLFVIASNILEKNNLSFDLLKPLIKETVRKVKNNIPSEMQTGPAIRNDVKTMKKHIDMLSSLREYQELYLLLSKSISNSTKKNK